MFSDGATKDFHRLENVIRPIKENGVIVEAVGIGNEYDLEEYNLLTIATGRALYFRRFTSDVFLELRRLISRYCE